MISVQPADWYAIRDVSNGLRHEDREELIAAHGLYADVRELILSTYHHSLDARVAYLNENAVCIFGVCPLPSMNGRAWGSPWFLATPELYRVPKRRLYKESFKYMEFLRSEFSYLVNFVHHRNLNSITWLRNIGFEVYAPEPRGVYGDLFCKFELKGEACVHQLS